MRKLRLKNFEYQIGEIENFEPNIVYISNNIFDENFEILVKVGDFVKIGEPILQKDGQNILSPIYGEVKSVKLDYDLNKELVYFVEIEKINLTKNQTFDEKIDEKNSEILSDFDQKNDIKKANFDAKNNEKNIKIHVNLSEKTPKIMQKNTNLNLNFDTNKANFDAKFDAKNNEKNANFFAKIDENFVNFNENFNENYSKNGENFNDKEYVFEKPKLNTKEDLILACKKFGIVSKHCFAYKIVEKTNKKLIIDAFDGDYEFNNQIIFKNFGEKIEKSIEFLAKILDVKKIEIYCNKKQKNDIKFLFNKLKTNAKKVIKTKQSKQGFTFEDLINIFNINFEKGQTKKIVSIVGKAIKKNCVLNLSFGAKIADILAFFGGVKENLDEVEDFKYMALVAFNDEQMLRQKIKNAKKFEDKQKLEKMLDEKQKQADENIFSKIEIYHQKYLNCLSALFLQTKKAKIPTKNLEFPINIDFNGIQFLSFEEFY